jgi:hypothetical protein
VIKAALASAVIVGSTFGFAAAPATAQGMSPWHATENMAFRTTRDRLSAGKCDATGCVQIGVMVYDDVSGQKVGTFNFLHWDLTVQPAVTRRISCFGPEFASMANVVPGNNNASFAVSVQPDHYNCSAAGPWGTGPIVISGNATANGRSRTSESGNGTTVIDNGFGTKITIGYRNAHSCASANVSYTVGTTAYAQDGETCTTRHTDVMQFR